ncbi:putative immunity protein [Micromonospora sp. DT233]|uniref:putative immunity protein n=1 Tax=Micromonospora sp. DT233 TaxID=3393432 RepID=UPI003CEF110C
MAGVDEGLAIDVSMAELRAVTGYAVVCAEPALAIFERVRPDDRRPRGALDAARAFVDGGRRSKAIRDGAWAAHRAYQETRDAGQAAASEVARAAVAAASAAYLHPLAKAAQVLHILGAAAHAARAFELDVGDDPAVGVDHVERASGLAGPAVVDVLTRYPTAPAGRGRAGELLRMLDAALRRQATDRPRQSRSWDGSRPHGTGSVQGPPA